MENLNQFISFFSFEEPNVLVVFWGSLILCGLSGLVGTFTFLRKRSLLGDVIAHSVLPGIALAFIIGKEKNTIYLLIGASISGWLSTYLVDYITQKSKIKTDTAIALVLSVFFGVGILLLTYIQGSGNANQSGLNTFIFGSASSMQLSDVYLFAGAATILGLVYIFLFRGFSLISFDEEFAETIGFPTELLKLLLSITTVLTVAMGVQAVGVVLMAALLITPAATARFWTYNVRLLAILSVIVSAVSGVSGAAISYISNGMPTGPWIVIVLSIAAFISAFIGKESGIIRKYLLRQANNKKILLENTIKIFYHLNDSFKNGAFPISKEELAATNKLAYRTLNKGLNLLKREELVKRTAGGFTLTSEGIRESKTIVRKHRLWELYLTRYMNLAPDHVHDDAEGIEHVITPEIELLLTKELGYPKLDPHNSKIPYPETTDDE